MKKNTLEDYQIAIKAKYEEVRSIDKTGFLYNPTPSGLRNLCLELLNSLDNNDKEAYDRFFTLKDGEAYKQIENFEISRFKPLCTFLKGATLTKSPKNLNLLAVLVDLKPRPFLKFSKNENYPLQKSANTYEIDDIKSTDTIVSEPIIVVYGNNEIKVQAEPANIEVEENTTKDEEKVNNEKNSSSPNPVESSYVPAERRNNVFTLNINRINLVLFIVVIISIVFIFKTNFFNEEGCMVWKEDHWEAISCDTEVKSFADMPIVHLDKETLERQRKIIATDTTTYFKNGKPVVWYYKRPDDTIEYFSYPGLHPVRDITLKPISQHIIYKYVIKNNSDKH